MVVYESASFFKARYRTHGHATAVLYAVGLCSWTAANQAHAAAAMSPLRYGRRIRHGTHCDPRNQPKQAWDGKGECWCENQPQAFWLSRQSSLTVFPDSTARRRLTSSNISVLANSPFSCHSKLRGSNNSWLGPLSSGQFITGTRSLQDPMEWIRGSRPALIFFNGRLCEGTPAQRPAAGLNRPIPLELRGPSSPRHSISPLGVRQRLRGSAAGGA